MKRLAVLVVAIAALAVPAGALASGVVLKVQRSTHLVAVARTKTSVALVHTSAASRLHVGQRVALTARKLRNGTLAASRLRVVGKAHTIHFRGQVLARSRTTLSVSAAGAVIRVHRGARTTSSASDDGPSAGATVDVTATVDKDGNLDEDDATVVSADHPGGRIEGKVTLGTGKITVVSDDLALVLNVPAGFDLTGVANGVEVLAVFAQQPDGTLLLTSLSKDGDEQEADDDNSGDDGGHDGHGGHDGGGGDDH